MYFKNILILPFIIFVLLGFTSCDDAIVADHNMEKAADNFEIMRRAVFYNATSSIL